MLPAGAVPEGRPPIRVDPATYSGSSVVMTLTWEQVRKLEVMVIRILPRGKEFTVYPFIDTDAQALGSLIQSKFLPPFWLCAKSMQPTVRRNDLGIAQSYRVQLSSDYLRDNETTFAAFVELLTDIGNRENRWQIQNPSLREKTIVIQLTNSTMSLPEQLVQTMPLFKPRPLTEDEKKTILNEIPPIRSCDTYVSALHHSQTLDHVRTQINDIILSPLRLNQFKQQIRLFYLRALYQAHEKVGIMATDSICAPVMQGMLNARHKFGTAQTGTVATVDQLEQVLLNQVIKNKEMTIYPTNRRSTEEDILKMKAQMEQVTMKISLVGGSTQGSVVIGVPQILVIADLENLTYTNWDPWWDAYVTLTGKAVLPSLDPTLPLEERQRRIREGPQLALVLNLNISILFEHNLSLDDVVAKLEATMPNSIHALASPVSYQPGDDLVMGTVVVIPIVDNAYEEVKKLGLNIRKEDPRMQQAFLGISVMKAIDKITLSGFLGVVEVVSRKYDLITSKASTILSETRLEDGVWELEFNRYTLRKWGIILEDYLYLFSRPEFGIQKAQIVEPRPTFSGLLRPDRIRANWFPGPKGPSSLLKHITDIVNNEMVSWKTARDSYREKSRSPMARLPLTPLLQANSLYYALTRGSNLKMALALDEVDSEFSYSNSPAEMMAAFGIEVAKAGMLILATNAMESNGMKIDLSHLMIAIEYQCTQGIILGLDYHGLDKRSDETLAKASAQKAESTISRAAATGKSDPTNSVSTSVLMGIRGNFGPARVKVEPRGLTTQLPPETMQLEFSATPLAPVSTIAAVDADVEELDAIGLATTTTVPLPGTGTIVPVVDKVSPDTPVHSVVPITDPNLVVASADPGGRIVSGYTSAVANLRIPLKADLVPAPQRFEIADLPIPKFVRRNLTLPKVLADFINSYRQAPMAPALPVTVGVPFSAVAPLPVAVPLKPKALSSLAGLLRKPAAPVVPPPATAQQTPGVPEQLQVPAPPIQPPATATEPP